jgi:serine phosphatase RsbU (regulator of sigma subunit)
LVVKKDHSHIRQARSARELLSASAGFLFRTITFKRNPIVSINGKKSEVMNSIYSAILSADSIEDSIRATIRGFRENFSFTRVTIVLFDFENYTFTPYGHGNDRSDRDRRAGMRFSMEQFPGLPVLLQHKSWLERDLSKKEHPTPLEEAARDKDGLRSYFVCPLVGKGELIGSLNFGSHLPNAFSEATINFCEEVANGIAMSLYQYSLQEKIKTINLVLERKEKNIIDSITYARRIQHSKLPTKELIAECVPDCFVLFKPKDIVSGDFYYFRKHKGAVFLAAADCTGHGVPGALMSMICSEILDDMITQTADTSQILAQLNKKIKHSLQQSDDSGSSKDGMDIALCNIDPVNRIVKFAGANRPVWLLRQGADRIDELKGTKKAIGGFTDDGQAFETHWIKMKPGDTLYLATDGYADTFGGAENKKLMTRHFKQLLLSIANKTMEAQKQYLDEFIEKWRVDLEQVDDILVIGVRM